MKLKTLIPFGVAIVLAAVAVQLGKGVLRKLAGGGGNAIKVVAATRELDPGYQIKSGDVALVSMPLANVPQGAITKLEEAVDHVAALPIVKGQTLVKPSIASDTAGMGLQALVPPGMRAVTMEVNEFSGVAGLLFPGCRVDVISTMIDEDTKRPVAKTIIQNAKVTAVGQKLSPKPGSKELVTTPNKSVTMIVSQKDAVTLDLASSKGRPRLVLRGAADDGPISVARVTLDELMRDRGGIAALGFPSNISPATQPSVDPFGASISRVSTSGEPFSVQVIQGGAVSEVRFEAAPKSN